MEFKQTNEILILFTFVDLQNEFILDLLLMMTMIALVFMLLTFTSNVGLNIVFRSWRQQMLIVLQSSRIQKCSIFIKWPNYWATIIFASNSLSYLSTPNLIQIVVLDIVLNPFYFEINEMNTMSLSTYIDVNTLNWHS